MTTKAPPVTKAPSAPKAPAVRKAAPVPRSPRAPRSTITNEATVSAPVRPAAPHEPVFRGSPRPQDAGLALGALQDLPGTWQGGGFNLISRPDKHDDKPFFLELNATQETLTFSTIGAPVPNRGSLQDDIQFLGIRYLQQISDAVTRGALHIEPGIWLNVPATTVPDAAASVVRMSTIPHGDVVLAQGTSTTMQGPPTIPAISSTPMHHSTGQPVTGATYLAPFTSTPPPANVPAGAIANPNVVLTDVLAHQRVLQTTVIEVRTDLAGGITNIPFVVSNANAIKLASTFWIETVVHPEWHGRPPRLGRGPVRGPLPPVPHFGTFLQLQYSQQVLLSFDGIDWPHISVATLVKQ